MGSPDGRCAEAVRFVRDGRTKACAQSAPMDHLERSDTESAWRESEMYLRLLLDCAADGFYAVSRDGTTTRCNAAALRMLGFEQEEDVIGKKLHPLVHHTHRDGRPYPKEECFIYRCAQTGESAHVTDELFFRTDGTPFPVEYWAHPVLRDGELCGAITTFVDITERCRAQTNLRFLAELSDEFAPLRTVEEIMDVAADKVYRHFDVSRLV